MNIDERIALIKQVGEEIVTEEDLRLLLEEKKHPIAYDGFEPSGTSIHIAQGLLRAININKMTKAGCKFKILVADWHAWANNKMDGNLENIQKVGKYLIEVWKACDMDMNNVEFVWVSDMVKDDKYWKIVMQIARSSTLKRIIRCSQIMGRKENDELQASQILYPCMQAADIFYLKADITQLGMDQRKVNMHAREVGQKLGFWRPVVVSHHMLMGLGEPMKMIVLIPKVPIQFDQIKEIAEGVYFKPIAKASDSELIYQINNGEFEKIKEGEIKEIAPLVSIRLESILKNNSVSIAIGKPLNPIDISIAKKMSKSKPDTAIFMTDSFEDVKRKINKAYCPEGVIEYNPILEYCKYILFEKFDKIIIERPEKWGGNLEFNSYSELEKSFAEKKLHPMDLKQTVTKYLDELLDPVRKKLEKNEVAKKLAEEIKNFQVTR